MRKRFRMRLDKWDKILWALLIVNFVAYITTLKMRASGGFDTFFTNWPIIFINDLSKDVFGYLILAILLYTVVKRAFRKQ